jgi:hypothetical protein
MFTIAAVVLGFAGAAGLAFSLHFPFEAFVVLWGVLALLIHLANAADAWVAARRRRRRGYVATGLTIALVGAIAHGALLSQGLRALQPGPAQIERLSCSAASCTVTTAGRATVIWVEDE